MTASLLRNNNKPLLILHFYILAQLTPLLCNILPPGFYSCMHNIKIPF